MRERAPLNGGALSYSDERYLYLILEKGEKLHGTQPRACWS